MGGERAICGTIKTPPTAGETQTGKSYVNISMSTGKKNQLLNCTAWGSMLGEEVLAHLAEAKEGDRITIKGFEGDSGCFVIKWFKLESGSEQSEEMSEREKIYECYGSKRKFEELQKEHFAEMEAKGFVQAYDDNGRFFFERKERCQFSKRRNRWVRKIDFCMDELGVKRVNEELTKILPNKEIKLGSIASFPFREYKKVLDRMVREALEREAHGPASSTVVNLHHGSISPAGPVG